MSQAETEELEPDDDTSDGRDVMPWTTTLEPAPMPADPFPLEEEPLPRLSVAESMRLYRFTALLPVLLLLGAAIALGLLRDPTYTATARSQVLIAASSPSSLAGSADAGTDFAATYARAIDAEEIVGQVARETDLTRDQVNDRISATPVPDAAVLSVSATGTNEEETVELANVTSEALQRYSQTTRGSSRRTQQLLGEFEQAALRHQRALDDEQQLARRAGDNPDADATAALNEANVRTQAALLERDALQQAFSVGQQLFTAPLRKINDATAASSDQLSRLQLLGFLGLLAGLAVGAALAYARANGTGSGRG